jgi:hypothetical protein
MYNKNIYVTIIATLLFMAIIFFVGAYSDPLEASDTDPKSTLPATMVEPAIDTPVMFRELEYEVFYDIDLSNKYLDTIYHAALEVDMAIGSGAYTDEAVSLMLLESARLHDIILAIKSDVEKYTKWECEYYYAAKVYERLRSNGYSAEIACAIIGNMMAECGGLTLKLNPEAYNANEHGGGLCGWLYRYYPDANGASFEKQCDLLLSSIKRQFDTFSFCYYNGFSYDKFLAMASVEDAALAFAKVYERCGASSYKLRQQAAHTAYNYFVLGK